MMDNIKNLNLADDDLDKVVGGVSTQGGEGDLRRVKCPKCGQPFMVNMKATEVTCPDISCGYTFTIGPVIDEGVKTLSGGSGGNTMLA